MLDLVSSYLSPSSDESVLNSSYDTNHTQTTSRSRRETNPFEEYIRRVNERKFPTSSEPPSVVFTQPGSKDFKFDLEGQRDVPSSRSSIEKTSQAYKLLREAFSELQIFSKVFEDNYIIE